MDFVLSYDSYKEENEFSKPIFLWNEASKCLKVGDYYLFVEKELMLKEGDSRLNEEFGISDMIPKTASDWIHLGVDGVSALVSAFGGKFIGVGIIIDIIHSAAYFMEAKYKPAEAFGLGCCGIITAVFAPIPAFGSESVGSAIIKRLISIVTKLGGGFFRTIFKVGSKLLGIPLLSRLFKYVFNLQPIRKIFLDIILKYQDTWIFKMLYKIPGIKQIINFIKNDLSLVLQNVEKYIAKDFIIFKNAVILESEKMFVSKFKSLDPVLSKMITEEQLGKLGKKMVTKELERFTPEMISKHPELMATLLKNSGETFTEKVCNSSMKQINTDLKIISSEIGKIAAEGEARQLIQREAVKQYIAKGTVKNLAYETIAKTAIKKLPSQVLKRIPSSLLKRLGIVAVKNSILYSDNDNTTNNDTATNGNKETQEIKKEEQHLNSTDTAVNFADDHGLTIEEVSNSSEIGRLDIEFRTPDKEGEEGKLILAGEVFNEYDLTPTMNLYPTPEELLEDLQFVGKKDADKEKLRDSQYKKWEKSGIRTTPWIVDLKCRYDFYFLIRERSDISLYRKNHIESVNFDFLDGDFKEYQKLNNSLFLIVKKVDRNG